MELILVELDDMSLKIFFRKSVPGSPKTAIYK